MKFFFLSLFAALLLTSCFKAEQGGYPCRISYMSYRLQTAMLENYSPSYVDGKRVTSLDCFEVPSEEILPGTEIYQCLYEEISLRINDSLVVLEVLPYTGSANVWPRNPCK